MTPLTIPKFVKIEIGQPLVKIKVLNVPYIISKLVFITFGF